MWHRHHQMLSLRNIRRFLQISSVCFAALFPFSFLSGCVESNGNPTAQPSFSPSPTATLNMTAGLTIQYDHALLSSRNQKLLGDAGVSFYTEIVQAAIGQELELAIPSPLVDSKQLDALLLLFHRLNPLGQMLEIDFSSDGQAIIFNYRYTRDRQDSLLREIKAAAEKVIYENIHIGYNQTDACIALYRYLSTHITYDISGPAHGETMDVLLRRRAVCSGFAFTVHLLLAQAGYDDGYIMEMPPSPSSPEGHMWNVLPLGKSFYHVDCTWEYSSTQKRAFSYFGITDKRRSPSVPRDSSMRYVFSELLPNPPSCTDERLLPLWEATAYSLGLDAHQLYLLMPNDSWQVLDTQNLVFASAESLKINTDALIIEKKQEDIDSQK